MPAILITIHVPTNTGYAIAALEKVFFEMACDVFSGPKNVHFAYSHTNNGKPTTLPSAFSNIIAFDMSNKTNTNKIYISNYIKANNIDTVFGFDIQAGSPMYAVYRKAGVKNIVAYWGAKISDENTGLKLLAKRLEVALRHSGPDLYIFESLGMLRLATHGRGIPASKTKLVHLGVNTKKYHPNNGSRNYIKQQFQIDDGKKIVYYSGHMEKRKGVQIIIEAAIDLIDKHKDNSWHFLICGNKPGEEQIFLDILKGKEANKHVTFAGYRTDLEKIIPGCFTGVIASTGWDSFTVSSLEIAACGLPLVVSNLPGLQEAVLENETGTTFEAGNSIQLSQSLQTLANSPETYEKYSNQAKKRIHNHFTIDIQRDGLVQCLRQLTIDKKQASTKQAPSNKMGIIYLHEEHQSRLKPMSET